MEMEVWRVVKVRASICQRDDIIGFASTLVYFGCMCPPPFLAYTCIDAAARVSPINPPLSARNQLARRNNVNRSSPRSSRQDFFSKMREREKEEARVTFKAA